MFVRMFAVAADNGASSGKRLRLRVDKAEIEVGKGELPGFEGIFGSTHLVIKASRLQQVGTGARGGCPKSYRRQFHVELTGDDLRDICIAALEAGLIDLPTLGDLSTEGRRLQLFKGRVRNMGRPRSTKVARKRL